MKLDRFINRPVLSTVISILIVILGILGLFTLPITQYPDIAPPTVSVRATYTGANAQTVLNSVIAPLEDQITGASVKRPDITGIEIMCGSSKTACAPYKRTEKGRCRNVLRRPFFALRTGGCQGSDLSPEPRGIFEASGALGELRGAASAPARRTGSAAYSCAAYPRRP